MDAAEADGAGDGLQFVVRCRNEKDGKLQTDECEMAHRASPDFLEAESPEVLAADAGDRGKIIQCPCAGGIVPHLFP